MFICAIKRFCTQEHAPHSIQVGGVYKVDSISHANMPSQTIHKNTELDTCTLFHATQPVRALSHLPATSHEAFSLLA